MKILKTLLIITGITVLGSCNNNAPKNETNPAVNEMDTLQRDHTEINNPDLGPSEMDNRGTDSIGHQTTGGK